MDKLLTLMNFSHVYENEKFYLNEEYNWVDCTNVNGTNGYCDEFALEILKEKVQAIKAEGIHFIDSGNYHYVSEVWIDKIKEDFNLIVFDHHSDMIKPVFGDILSCGSWIMDVVEHNNYLKKVLIIGLSRDQKKTILNKYQDKVICICDDELKSNIKEVIYKSISDKYPVYISIDKDVLDKKVVNTSWDQGKMDFKALKDILHMIISKYKIIGIDICGENEVNRVKDIEINDEVNIGILKFLSNEEIFTESIDDKKNQICLEA